MKGSFTWQIIITVQNYFVARRIFQSTVIIMLTEVNYSSDGVNFPLRSISGQWSTWFRCLMFFQQNKEGSYHETGTAAGVKKEPVLCSVLQHILLWRKKRCGHWIRNQKILSLKCGFFRKNMVNIMDRIENKVVLKLLKVKRVIMKNIRTRWLNISVLLKGQIY